MSSCVVLRDDREIDVRKYAPRAAELSGLTVLEAKMALKKGRGIPLRGIPREKAVEFAAMLTSDGIGSDVVDQDTLPRFPTSTKVTFVGRDETMLTYRKSSAPAVEAVAWKSLAAVAVGIIPAGSYEGFMGGVQFKHLPSMREIDDVEDQATIRERVLAKAREGGRFRRIEVESRDNPLEELERKQGTKIRVHVDCVSGDLREWLRVNMAEFSYEINPNKPKYGGSWGMKYLLDDIRKKASPEALTPVTRAFLRDGDPNILFFADIEEFRQDTEWFLVRASIVGRRLGVHDSNGGEPESIELEG